MALLKNTKIRANSGSNTIHQATSKKRRNPFPSLSSCAPLALVLLLIATRMFREDRIAAPFMTFAVASDLSPLVRRQRTTTTPASSSTTVTKLGIQETAWALRWTGEVNHRLHQELAETPASTKTTTTTSVWLRPPPPPPPLAVLRGGQSLVKVRPGHDQDSTSSDFPVNMVHHSTTSRPLTKFHASMPKTDHGGSVLVEDHGNTSPCYNGAARWGPPLESFLQRALNTIFAHEASSLDEQQSHLLTTALIYLDRATSVSTPRSSASAGSFHSSDNNNNNAVGGPLPFCTPRTVHRLILTALALAKEEEEQQQQQQKKHGFGLLTPRAQSNRRRSVPSHSIVHELAREFGIPNLPDMVQEMRLALGDFGSIITPTQRQDFVHALTQSPILQRLSYSATPSSLSCH